MDTKKLDAAGVHELNATVQTAPIRKVKAVGGNPDGDVCLSLDDGSIVVMKTQMVDFVLRVRNEGLAQKWPLPN